MAYKYLYEKTLCNDLSNEISILDDNHCLEKESFFSINIDDYKSRNNFEFSVSGEDNIFKGNFSDSNITLRTQEEDLVFYLKNEVSKNIIKREIYKNKNQKNCICEIKSKSSEIFQIEFMNLIKKEIESVEMINDNYIEICDIFYEDKQKGSQVICKIIRNENICNISISSGVDYIFMIGLASFFFCKEINERTISYDNIAKVKMTLNNNEVSEYKIEKSNPIDSDTAESQTTRNNKNSYCCCNCCSCCSRCNCYNCCNCCKKCAKSKAFRICRCGYNIYNCYDDTVEFFSDCGQAFIECNEIIDKYCCSFCNGVGKCCDRIGKCCDAIGHCLDFCN